MPILVMDTRGSAFDGIAQLGIALATVAIILTATFIIMSQGKDQILEAEGFSKNNGTNCVQSIGCNATSTLQEAVDDVPDWMPIVVLVGIGAVILLLVRAFRTNA